MEAAEDHGVTVEVAMAETSSRNFTFDTGQLYRPIEIKMPGLAGGVVFPFLLRVDFRTLVLSDIVGSAR